MANSRICSIPGCDKPVRNVRGWCNAHYTRWRKYGDVNTKARPANGEALAYFHDVVLAYEGDECLTWPYNTGSTGYGQLRYDGKQARVSRLVCEHVYGPAPDPSHHAAHSCGKGHEACVNPSHLSWKTPSENAADKLEHGTYMCGERQNGAKLTEADVRKIRALRGRVPQRQLAVTFGVARETISQIQLGKKWRELD